MRVPPESPGGWIGYLQGLARVLHDLIRRLGWFFVLALAVAAMALWGFAEVADEVLEKEFDAINHLVMDRAFGLRRPWLDRVALGITLLGSVSGVALIGSSFGLWLLYRRRLLDAAVLAIVLGGGAVLTLLLKALFGNPRPALWSPLAHEPSFSFPSGHAVISVCLFGYVAIWLVACDPAVRWRWAVALACGLLAAAIALSRVYLGVHWPTDIVAGVLVGVFWLAVCWAGQRWITGHRTIIGEP